ncbi:MAG: glycosyltransferase family 2 protein [Isosphaeraceae bacterium]
MTRIPTPTRRDPFGAARPPLVSAVVVNYNAWPDVEALVLSLAGSPEVQAGLVEVLVVDNASEGPVPESLREPRRGVRLILRSQNGGFAVGVNTGWRESQGRWLLLLNPDVVVPDGWLGRVAGRVQEYEGNGSNGSSAPGVVGFALRNPDGSRQHSVGAFPSLGRAIWEQLIPRSRRKYQAGWRTASGPVDWVTGACVLVNARVLEAVGGLDEEFFLYYEEVALCRSVRRLGWRVEYDPDPSLAVVHLRPLQNRALTPRMRVITRHSKLLYFRKHLPRWQFLGLCAVVAAESRIQGAWARFRGLEEEGRAWRVVSALERDLRAGVSLGGVDVLTLANSVRGTGPSSIGPACSPKRSATRSVDEPRAEARHGSRSAP